mgnify:FL=1
MRNAMTGDAPLEALDDVILVRFQLALPDNKLPPPRLGDLASNLFIACNVFKKLGIPKIEIRFRRVSVFAAGMSMPETAMNKDRNPESRKDDVGPSWQRFVKRTINGEPETGAVQQRPDSLLRAGML